MSSMVSIAVNKVSKVYPLGGGLLRHEALQKNDARPDADGGDKVAVDDVSLEIRHGDRLGIVGVNGAGKSTLLHIIAGLAAPTSGTVDVNGKVTSIMTLGVGLREDFSGRENIYLDGELQNQSRQETDRVIDSIIDFAELGEFIDHPVRTYSTGMKARLAFAMITHIEPEILIVDEALSAGDAAFSAKASARIREICDKGKIVILVSHSMGTITDMCNRCLWMENGRVIMDGRPKDVTEAYIEAVRSADETALLARFIKLTGNHSFTDGWSIQSAGIFSVASSKPSTLLEAGRPASIRAIVELPGSAEGVSLVVKITRLDGAVLFDKNFPADLYLFDACLAGLEIELKPLILGAATYRLDIGVGQGGREHALSSSIFEVFSMQPIYGGKPMLLYPMEISEITHN